MKKAILFSLISILFLTSCKAKEAKPKEAKVYTFKSVSMEEGLKLLASDKDFILLAYTDKLYDPADTISYTIE